MQLFPKWHLDHIVEVFLSANTGIQNKSGSPSTACKKSSRIIMCNKPSDKSYNWPNI